MINVDYSSLVDHAGEPPSLVAGLVALAMWLYRRFTGSPVESLYRRNA